MQNFAVCRFFFFSRFFLSLVADCKGMHLGTYALWVSFVAAASASVRNGVCLHLLKISRRSTLYVAVYSSAAANEYISSHTVSFSSFFFFFFLLMSCTNELRMLLTTHQIESLRAKLVGFRVNRLFVQLLSDTPTYEAVNCALSVTLGV